jgi:hypothetical protein
MLLDRLDLTPEDITQRTGWAIRPEGACKGEICVPLAGLEVRADGTIDMRLFAEQMAMPLVTDDKYDLSAIGPRAAGRVLDDAALPMISLPDFDGDTFELASLRGRKVALVAWASW